MGNCDAIVVLNDTGGNIFPLIVLNTKWHGSSGIA